MFIAAGNVNENYSAPPAHHPAKKPKMKQKQKKICPSCHTCFQPSNGNQKYCTKLCRKHYREEKHKASLLPRKRTARKKVKTGAKRRKRTTACVNCRQKFTPTCVDQKYCTQKCRTQAKRCRTKKEKEKILRGLHTGFNGCCYLCGLTIPLDVPAEHPLLLTRDHIIPRTLGGENNLDNIAPAHKLCNNVKGCMSAQDFWSTKKLSVMATIAHHLQQLYLAKEQEILLFGQV